LGYRGNAEWLSRLSDRDSPDPDDAWVQRRKDEATKEDDDDAEESNHPKAKKA
jgi:hypothetical protein